MNKKDLIFTVGLTVLMGVLWVIGEVVMGLWIGATARVRIIWFIMIVAVTLGINIWHSLKEDRSDYTDPKAEKYERKVNKRKKNS